MYVIKWKYVLCVQEGSNKVVFMKEITEDVTLQHCKRLATRKERGYRWEKGIIIQKMIDPVMGEVERIVVPKHRQQRLLELAHERNGHLGYRKVIAMLIKQFTWPNLSSDVTRHCKSCEICQRASKSGQKRVPMVERPVVTEPFEVIALDIVDPLPLGKGKVSHILTAICMATRQPEVVP